MRCAMGIQEIKAVHEKIVELTAPPVDLGNNSGSNLPFQERNALIEKARDRWNRLVHWIFRDTQHPTCKKEDFLITAPAEPVKEIIQQTDSGVESEILDMETPLQNHIMEVSTSQITQPSVENLTIEQEIEAPYVEQTASEVEIEQNLGGFEIEELDKEVIPENLAIEVNTPQVTPSIIERLTIEQEITTLNVAQTAYGAIEEIEHTETHLIPVTKPKSFDDVATDQEDPHVPRADFNLAAPSEEGNVENTYNALANPLENFVESSHDDSAENEGEFVTRPHFQRRVSPRKTVRHDYRELHLRGPEHDVNCQVCNKK